MASKQRPPLTPADSRYKGLDRDGWHTLEWPSQTRPEVKHETHIHGSGAWLICTCEGFAHRGWCKHAGAARDALAHHLGAPPPADPGEATPCRPCWHCPTRQYCAEHGCRYTFAALAADPGGAAGGRDTKAIVRSARPATEGGTTGWPPTVGGCRVGAPGSDPTGRMA